MLVLLALFSLAFGQLGPIFFPPQVRLVNSDMNLTVYSLGQPQTAYGHMDMLVAGDKSSKIHVFFAGENFPSMEEWIFENSGDIKFFLLMGGECHTQDVQLPSLNCTGWTETSDGGFTQTCYVPGFVPGSGDAEIQMYTELVDNQPTYWEQKVDSPNGKIETVLIFKSTTGQPPADSAFQPPSNCPPFVTPPQPSL